jgi:hypothetical protein
MSRNVIAALVLATTALASAVAQTGKTVYRLVLPVGKGAVAVHFGDGWIFGKAHTLPDGQRSVMQTYNPALDITESVSIFPTLTPDPSSEACRQTIFTPSLEDITHRATVQDITRSTYTTKDGRTLATASYIIAKAGDDPIHQLSLSAYIGGAQLCAEMHLSKAHFQPSDLAAFHAEFDRFQLDLNYVPVVQDYLIAADLYSVAARENASAALYDRAALYYRGALKALPPDDHSTRQRLVTSRLADAWLQSGDPKRARDVYETALTKDPSYPEYDFGLARMDAVEGHADAAKTHLQNAFEHRANLPPGTRLPDPTQDPAILKLKSDKAFWDFVEALPRD